MYLIDVRDYALISYNWSLSEGVRETLPYTILSHTWEDEEVSFADIQDLDRAKLKAGFGKIQGACDIALSDGFRYIWIDTCCIDKSSSAELSEAINSMYNYYHDAELCYVYLSDIDGRRDKRASAPPFIRSKWFSRGWTLQELITPRTVIFYARDWSEVGTKSSLQEVISAHTQIPAEALLGNQVANFSVAQRMSWAAYRNTTRIEDTAYCLMGIFHVNMPIIYGEGSRAFQRLQNEIMKQSDDQSLFAWWTPSAPERSSLHARSPRDFGTSVHIVARTGGISSEYTMTNRGLKIQLPLIPLHPNSPDGSQFLAVFNCAVKGDEGYMQSFVSVVRLGGPEFYRCHQPVDLKDDHLQYLSGILKLPPATEMLFPHKEEDFVAVKREALADYCYFCYRGTPHADISLVDSDDQMEMKNKSQVRREVPRSTVSILGLESTRTKTAFSLVLGWDDDDIAWCDVVLPHERLQEESLSDIESSYQESGLRNKVARKCTDYLSRKLDEYDTLEVSLRKSGFNAKPGIPQFAVKIRVSRGQPV